MMKRLTFFLAMTLSCLFAKAQDWTPVDEYRYNDETIVYARLATGDDVVDNDPSRFSVGAFIDGECRGTANATQGENGTYIYVVRVHGDSDDDHDKSISFMVFDRVYDYIFDATPSRPVLFTGESEGEPSNCIVLSFNVSSYVPLRGFTVSVDALCATQTGQLRLTPVPSDAMFRPETLTLAFTGFPEQWVAATCQLASTSPLIYSITPQVPGEISLSINQGKIPFFDASGNSYSSTSFRVAYPVRLAEGWQWMTNAYGKVATEEDFRQVYGGNDLVEIRTHEHLLYNDPEWGYFGTLLDGGLPQNTAYKVRMKNGPFVGRLWNGGFQRGMAFQVESGWSWIPSPYYYNRLFSSAFTQNGALPVGLTIISKEGGQAEWNGSGWVGDLPALMAGQFFLCYNPADYAITLTYADEMVMTQGDEAIPSAPVGPWDFDASGFSDNMTLVASVPGLDSPGDYVIGAFVGNECRGEGHWSDGRFFITAHVAGFEEVSFRLCHLPTGHEYDIDESFGVQLHLGSVNHPVALHSMEFITGIASAESGAMQSVHYYDLMGRRVSSDHRGPTIIRQDGRRSKVIINR